MDDLMRDEGLSVLPDPERPVGDWEQRRHDFATDGFEQILGDRIFDALKDRRSVDRDAFEQVLAENDVTLTVTDRDGWSFKMRRLDNGKYGRRKASRLAPEFTAEGAQEIFNIHAQNAQQGAGHGAGRRAATAHFGDVGGVDLDTPRRRAAAHEADNRRREAERVPADERRG